MVRFNVWSKHSTSFCLETTPWKDKTTKLNPTINHKTVSRFLSSPFAIRAPFFLLWGFNKGAPCNKNDKRVLLRNPGLHHPSGERYVQETIRET